MRPKPYASWDCPVLPDSDRENLIPPLREAERAARASARTRLFEAAAEGHAPAAVASIEFIRRRGEFRWRAARSGQGRGLPLNALYVAVALGGIIAIMAILARTPPSYTPWVAATLAVALAAVLVRIARPDRRLGVIRAIDTAVCPDCDYDLSGVIPGLDPEGTGGINVGPRWCPECGAPWPLVPPPEGVQPSLGVHRTRTHTGTTD